MTLRPILIYPDPRLKKACPPALELTDDLRRLLDDMLETMYDAPGVGLAAPQVGVLARVVVMDVSKEDAPLEPIRMINPEIIAASDDLNTHNEGCLSIPDQFADIARPAQVTVRYRDENWEEQTRDCDGLLATCVQHEIDHLNGKLFVDYIGSVRRSLIMGKMKKLKRDLARKGKATA